MIDIDGFRRYLYEEEMAASTIVCYVHAVRLYAKRFSDITKENLISFKQDQLSRFKPATVNLRIAGMLSYCRYAKIDMHLKSVKLPRRTSVDNVITQDQLDKILSGLEKDQNRCWIVNILMLSKTGMRISEAIRIRKRDLTAGNVTMQTKDHMRTIYFPQSLIDAIGEDISELGQNDFVLRGKRIHDKKPLPITVRGFRAGLKRIGALYGVPAEVMHPHSFRHFFAIEFLKRKNDIALLADLLGHSNMDMTRIYLRQSREKQADAVNQAVKW